jgi:hypothetical protein
MPLTEEDLEHSMNNLPSIRTTLWSLRGPWAPLLLWHPAQSVYQDVTVQAPSVEGRPWSTLYCFTMFGSDILGGGCPAHITWVVGSPHRLAICRLV